MVHIDGLRERHDESVNKDGGLRRGGGRHQAGTGGRLPGDDQHHLLQHRHAAGRHRRPGLPQRRARVDNMQISPGYAYEKAPDQEHWLGVEETRELFRKAFAANRPRSGG
jgi:hypothetical protein